MCIYFYLILNCIYFCDTRVFFFFFFLNGFIHYQCDTSRWYALKYIFYICIHMKISITWGFPLWFFFFIFFWVMWAHSCFIIQLEYINYMNDNTYSWPIEWHCELTNLFASIIRNIIINILSIYLHKYYIYIYFSIIYFSLFYI